MAERNPTPAPPDSTLRFLGQVALATALWAATFAATKADWLTARATSVPARLALVAIGIGGFLPVVFVYAKSIRLQDEFNQRLHLVALGVAFAALGVLSYSVDLLHQAHFIGQPGSGGLWALMLVVWFVTMMLVPRFYR
jgi:hypothetical protein